MNEIIGGTPAIERFRRHLPSLAQDPAALVFIGEAGVGKSYLAEQIHSACRPANLNAKMPSGSINFSILSDRDQRIVLFGAEPPELTSSRRSLLELPTTIILKHIDYAAAYLQDKLAASLEEGSVVRFGSQETHPVACRIIFTFRESVSSLRRNGKLSQSLYGLCSSLKMIQLPPLRKRSDDIPLLAEYFVKNLRVGHGSMKWRGFDHEGRIKPVLAKLLQSQVWKDNIRDLLAYVRTLMIPSFEEEIDEREKIELIKILLMIERGSEFSLAGSISKIEECMVARALERQAGHLSRAAHLLGLSDRTLRRKLGR